MKLNEEQFDEAIEYLEEKFEVLVTRPKDFFKKKITLYRGDKTGNFDGVVHRTYLNAGTRISGPRASSFWSDNEHVALIYLIKSSYLKFLEASENEIPEVLVDYYKKKKKKIRRGFNYKDDHLVIFYKDKEEKDKLLKEIKNLKLVSDNGNPGIYLHKLNVHGWDRDLGIGHNPYLREFTIDRDVVPTESIKFTHWPEEIINSIEWVNDPEEFIKKNEENSESETYVGGLEGLLKYHGSSNPNKPYKNIHGDPKPQLKTNFFRDEFIKYVDKGGTNFFLITDAHVGHNKRMYRDVLNDAYELGEKFSKLKKENPPEYLLILGDFIDKTWMDHYGEIIKTFTAPLDRTPKVLFILGNGEHDFSPIEILRDAFAMKKIFHWAGYKIETDKYIFSHAPFKTDDDKIFIHGHLHGSNKYWNADPKKCINVSKRRGEFIHFDDVLKIGVSEDGIELKDDPTGGKKNKVMTKLYNEYSKKQKFNEAIEYLEEATNESLY